MAHTLNTLDAERDRRNTRRLNIALYHAALHATGHQHLQLLALKHAVRDGHIALTDAITLVNQLRAQQQHHRKAA